VKQDDNILVEIPVTIGAVGAVVLPSLAALGVLVAVFKRCTIEVVRNDGNTDHFSAQKTNDEGNEDRDI
jgi:hypothetical protein